MRYRKLRQNSRESFTLIELIVVISIIAILASLLLAGVMKILSKRPEVAAATEMKQMGGGLQQFEQAYGVSYVPSRLHVCQNVKSYGNSQLDHESRLSSSKTIGKEFGHFHGTGTGGRNWH